MGKKILFGFGPPITISFGSLIFLLYQFLSLPNEGVLFVYTIDAISILLTYMVVLGLFKRYLNSFINDSIKDVSLFISSKIFYFIIFVSFFFYAYNAIKFQQSISDVGVVAAISKFRTSGDNYITLLLKRVVEILFVFAVFDKKTTNKVKLLLGVNVILITYAGFSRSELSLVLYLCFLYLGFYSGVEFRKTIKYVVMIMFISLMIAAFITIFQGRQSDFNEAVFNALEKVFEYRIYAIYLSEQVINLPRNSEGVFFTLFGFLGERFSLLISTVDTVLVSQGSTFVSDFIYIGNGNFANALYPWWSWFYNSFGMFGIFLKALYTLVVFWVLLVFRLRISFFFFTYMILYRQQQRHIFMTTNDFYQFLGVIIVDLLIIYVVYRAYDSRKKVIHNNPHLQR